MVMLPFPMLDSVIRPSKLGSTMATVLTGSKVTLLQPRIAPMGTSPSAA